MNAAAPSLTRSRLASRASRRNGFPCGRGAELAGLPDGIRMLFNGVPSPGDEDCGVIGFSGGFGVKAFGSVSCGFSVGGCTGADCCGRCAGIASLNVAGCTSLPSGLVPWLGVRLVGLDRFDLMS